MYSAQGHVTISPQVKNCFVLKVVSHRTRLYENYSNGNNAVILENVLLHCVKSTIQMQLARYLLTLLLISISLRIAVKFGTIFQ